MEATSDIEFIKTDVIMNTLYKEYIVEKKVPDKGEIKTMLHFLATFAMGCRLHQMKELGDLYCKRVNCYFLLLLMLGYKFGKAYGMYQGLGLYEEIRKILYGVRVN